MTARWLFAFFLAAPMLLASSSIAEEALRADAPRRAPLSPDAIALLDQLGCGAPRQAPPIALAPPADGRLDILAVGSSSTSGGGAGGPGQAYPALLEAELGRRLREADAAPKIRVVARGVPGERAAGALERFEREIRDAAPDILIWQVGTNDALAYVPLERLAQQIRAGAAIAAAHGLPMILVDPQYFPDIAGDEHYAGAAATIARTAAELGAPLAPRFERMRAAEAIGPEAMTALLARDRFHMSLAGHACLALDLAETLAPATR